MQPILKPVVLLVLWSIFMFVWAAYARSKDPAAIALGINGMKRTAEVGPRMSPASQYKIDNYNHLMEQPTIFYAIVAVLAIAGGATSFQVGIAWAYVASRIVHSVVQATSNDVRLRLLLFILGTIAIVVLAGGAALRAFA